MWKQLDKNTTKYSGSHLNIKMSSYQYRDPHVEEMTRDCLIFNIGIPIPVKGGLYIERGPWPLFTWPFHISLSSSKRSEPLCSLEADSEGNLINAFVEKSRTLDSHLGQPLHGMCAVKKYSVVKWSCGKLFFEIFQHTLGTTQLAHKGKQPGASFTNIV